MSRGEHGARTRETRRDRRLQRRSRIVTMNDIGPQTPEGLYEAQKRLGKRGFSQDKNRKSLCEELLADASKVAVGDYRGVMAVFSLQAAQLSDKNLGATHLQAVNNVNDLHAGPCAQRNRKPDAEMIKSNLHNTNRCIPPRMHGDMMATFLISIRLRMPVRRVRTVGICFRGISQGSCVL